MFLCHLYMYDFLKEFKVCMDFLSWEGGMPIIFLKFQHYSLFLLERERERESHFLQSIYKLPSPFVKHCIIYKKDYVLGVKSFLNFDLFIKKNYVNFKIIVKNKIILKYFISYDSCQFVILLFYSAAMLVLSAFEVSRTSLM